MLNFEIINPTRIVFGKDQLDRLPSLINEFSASKRILLAYGGGSIKANGLFDRVMEKLHEFNVIEFGGIEANPQFETLMKGVRAGAQRRLAQQLPFWDHAIILCLALSKAPINKKVCSPISHCP
jgi:NADP-dependent alcohol dehydrogenase